MKTNKNTFPYLCFVFLFAAVHYYMERMDIVLSGIFPIICLFYSARCTGFSRLCKSPRSIVVTIAGGLACAALSPALEKLVIAMMNGRFTFKIMPFAMIPSLILSIVLALMLCKLRDDGSSKLALPGDMYVLLIIFPPFMYLMLGFLLCLVDVEALELALSPPLYSGSVAINYNYAFFGPMKDICMGWSIFVMMKYNQSMNIKKLFEMQNSIT